MNLEYYDYLCQTYENIKATYFEADIEFKKHGLLKFYFANDFVKILNAYIGQTKNSVCLLDEIKWKANKRMSNKISNIMIKYNVDYAMTFYMEGEYRVIKFYKRAGGMFYFVNYCVKPSKKERTSYFKRNYPFYFYSGYFAGFFHSLFGRLKGGNV